MIKGKRRFIGYLATLAGLIAIEIANPFAGGGLSGNGQLGIAAASALYFGSVAVDKSARAKHGNGEQE